MYKYWNYKKVDKTFALKLKALRLASGLTQEELAEKVSVSRSSISNYESGNREPNNETLKRLAEYFDVLVDYLTGNAEISALPFEKNKIEDFHVICKRIKSCGNSIDISGIPMEKKLAIIDYCDYVMRSAEKA